MHSEVVITFILYFMVILFIGYLASRKTKDMSDFILGGRSLNGPIAALGAGASDMSGWLLLALPGAFYVSGFNQIWMPIGLVIGAYCNWLFVAKPLRFYTEEANDSLTIPAYFENRFVDKTKLLRVVTGCVVIIFFSIYAAAGFVGGALLLQTGFDIPYHEGLLLGAAVIIAYTTIGGFLAVNWVDFFQGTLMFIALLFVPAWVIFVSPHSTPMEVSLSRLPENFWHPLNGLNAIGVISLLAWGLGYLGQPHILVRFMACKTKHVIPVARRICMTWMIFSLIGAMATGLIGAVYFLNAPLAKPETVFLQFAQRLFIPWVTGFLFAAVLSAIMSTISAQLLASSSSLTEDIYRRHLRKKASSRELLWVSRLTVLLVAVAALAMAYDQHNTILNLVSYAWAGLGAAFGPVVVLSLYWRKMTCKAAITGIITAAIVVIAWKNMANLGGIFKLYEMVPGFFAGTLTIIIISLIWPQNDPNVLARHERVRETLHH